MGRRKIDIEPIHNERIRRLTYEKRAEGLLKKAMELSILCKVEVVLLILEPGDQLVRYGSNGLMSELQRYSEMEMNRVRQDRPYRNLDVCFPRQGARQQNVFFFFFFFNFFFSIFFFFFFYFFFFFFFNFFHFFSPISSEYIFFHM